MRKTNIYKVMSAQNQATPTFYRAVSDGKKGIIAFPGDYAKAYFLKCLKSIVKAYPLEISAYSIVNNRAYFIIASYDQTVVTLERFISEINAMYSEYYNKYINGEGYVFRATSKTKKITDGASSIAEDIVVVHSQPVIEDLSADYNYKFSSYSEGSGGGISDLNGFFVVAGGYETAMALLGEAHANGPKRMPYDFLRLPKTNRFDAIIENVLVDYKCYGKKAVTNDIMHRIIAEVNDRGGYTFDYITKKMALNKQDRYEMLIKVIADLAITKGKTYDSVIDSLDVGFDSPEEARTVLIDVVVMISNRTGYSYDYIMNMLGLAYPNYNFLVNLIKYMSDMKGLSYPATIKKLGIHDNIPHLMGLLNR